MINNSVMSPTKILSILLLTLFSTPLMAGPFSISCTSKDGKPVTFKALPTDVIYARGFAMAMAGLNKSTGGRIIYYDGNLYKKAPRDFQRFTLFHECAHHALGHIRPGMNPRVSISLLKENEADCYAKKRLIAAGGNMETVYKTFMNANLMKAMGASPNVQRVRPARIKNCRKK